MKDNYYELVRFEIQELKLKCYYEEAGQFS